MQHMLIDKSIKTLYIEVIYNVLIKEARRGQGASVLRHAVTASCCIMMCACIQVLHINKTILGIINCIVRTTIDIHYICYNIVLYNI